MSDDQDLVDKLRAARPPVPEDAKFWDDFARDVRVAYDARRPRRRVWAWLLPLPLAAAAALYLVISSHPEPDGSRVPTRSAGHPAPRLPPPDDIEELPDDQLRQVLVDTDDGEDIDIEDLDDADVRLLYEALKGA